MSFKLSAERLAEIKRDSACRMRPMAEQIAGCPDLLTADYIPKKIDENLDLI